MKKTLYLSVSLLIIFFFLGAGLTEAGYSGVELKLISSEHLDTEPGKVVTLSLVVFNHSGFGIDFSEGFELPSDWQIIIPPASFKLDAYDQQVRLVSFFIPSNSPAGL